MLRWLRTTLIFSVACLCIRVIISSSEGCPEKMFNNGSQCVPCNCNINNTASCNKNTGTCICMTGYSGEFCDCITGKHHCNLTYSYCGLRGNIPICICRPGFYGENLGCFETLRYAASTDLLEVFVDGLWNLIKPTSPEWDAKLARVACRQMGLPTFYTNATKQNKRSHGHSKAISHVKCKTGNESEIALCQYKKSYYSLFSQYLGAVCQTHCPDFMYGEDCRDCACNRNNTINCTKDFGKCVCKPGYEGKTCDCTINSHHCNSSFSFCGQPKPTCYCKGGFDSKEYNCTETVKLVKVSLVKEEHVGELQVYRKRRWYTICDIGQKETIVVCKQLNLPQRYTDVMVKTDFKYRNLNHSTVYMNKMNCTGNETAVSECSFSKTPRNWASPCSFYVYIIRCFDACPDWMYGDRCNKRCQCNTNTSTSCDSNTGSCNCKNGYFGNTCTCRQGFHTCNTKTSICYTNSSGYPICLCRAGVDKDKTCEKNYVALENTKTGKEGSVLIFRNGVWKRACKYGWNSARAKVVCRHLQLPWTFAQVIGKKYKVPRKNIQLFNFTCTGNESSLFDCQSDTTSSYKPCNNKLVAAIICSEEPIVRLISTNGSSNIGLVQVKVNGKYGYICAGGWGTLDASVACRELGLPTKYVTFMRLNYTRGVHETHITNVGCSGREDNLADCRFIYRNGTKCYRHPHQRAGVSCQPKCPRMKFGTNCRESCVCNGGNTRTCDDDDGTCICKTGFSGDFCNCRNGYNGCNTTISTCHEENSTVYCMCKENATSRTNNCTEPVRLLDRGAVQVFIGGLWATVCGNSNWSWKNSKVICRQLDLSTKNVYIGRQRAAVALSGKSYAVYDYDCSGMEPLLSQCTRSISRRRHCSYETKVLCGGCPDWKYSANCFKDCECYRENTLSCNIKNGSCTCKEGFYGRDCNCKDNSIWCDETFSVCKHDRCVCKEGEYDRAVSCSDFQDVIYYCTFSDFNFKQICQVENWDFYWRLHTRSSEVSIPWRPRSGPYDETYLYIPVKIPIWGWSSASKAYRSTFKINLSQKLSQICVMFYYTTHSYGGITVLSTNVNGEKTIRKRFSGQTPSWTEAFVFIDDRSNIKMIHFELELKTTIDNIVVRKGQCSCPDWRFGSDCNKCTCVRLHTQSCNSTSGACVCKEGYTGPACQCTENESPCLHVTNVVDVRLVNSNSSDMGRVEVLYDGMWTTVCGTDWDDVDATVVCKQLGLSEYGIAKYNAYFGEGSGPVIIKGVFCNTTSASLHDCLKVRGTCDHSNDAGVLCKNASNTIRLVGGKTKGRLEVIVPGNSEWGAVCNDGFDSNDAKVACRQLKLPMKNIEFEIKVSYDVTPMHMTNLGCRGTELTLQNCGYDKTPSCIHKEAISITCSNDCPKWKYGPACSENCDCVKSNSLSCNLDTGLCNCKGEWYGHRCTCSANMTCSDGSYCDSNECICNEGILRNSGTNCSGETTVLYHCSFERSLDDCFMFMDNSSTMLWLRNKDRTPSSKSGPFNAYKGSFYIYTETSGRPQGAKAVLWLNLLKSNNPHCLQFYYHMNGLHMGTLKIEVYDEHNFSTGLWEKCGNIANVWIKGEVPLKSRAYKIKIEGIRGSGLRSVIALDHMTIKDGHCDCPAWKYGEDCTLSCMCTRETSVGCNSTDGSCFCVNGWSGKYCDCNAEYNMCNDTYSYCLGKQCLCKDGQHGKTFSCSGFNGLIYFCSFETSQSYKKCMIHMDFPRQWIITENHGFYAKLPSRMKLHGTESNHYLKTTSETGRSMFSFSLSNISVERQSCLKVRYGSVNYAIRKLRIYVLNESGRLVNNVLTVGHDWTLVQVHLPPMKTSTIYFIAYDSSTFGTIIDDLMITDEKCDIKECSDFTDHCNSSIQFCINTEGSFNCMCRNESFGDKNLCSSTNIALVNGSTSFEGHLLLYMDKIWGSLCYPLDLKYALNGCKQLFKTSYGVTVQEREMFEFNNGISYQDMKCPYRETDLSSCNVSIRPCERQLYMKCYGRLTPKEGISQYQTVCGGVYTSEYGILEPPGDLDANSLCHFLIKASRYKTIKITFTSFDLESSVDVKRSACSKNYVEVFDGPNENSPSMGIFCGKRQKFTMSSSKHELFIKYAVYIDTPYKHSFKVVYETESEESEQTQEERRKMWLIPVLLCIAILIIVLVVVLIYAAKKMRSQYKSNMSVRYSELLHHSNLSAGFNNKDSQRGSFISIEQFPQDGEHHRIRLTEFQEAYATRKAEENWPKEEFMIINQSCQQRPCETGSFPQNKHKNRDDTVIPYDFNRVRNSTTGFGDYINASIIEGLHTQYPFYIATQLPTESTQKDFWRMIWKQRASTIVNLAVAGNKDLYYPIKVGFSKTYGNMKVQTITVLTFGGCVFRCIRLSKGSRRQNLNHFQSSHLASFHQNVCSDIVDLVKLVNSYSEGGGDIGPRVIHCWNGTGRTGVYIAVDYLFNLIESGETNIDICKVVQLLLCNRMKLIETAEQYQFIYDCVDHCLKELDNQNTQESVQIVEDEDADLIRLSPESKRTVYTKKY